MAAHTEEIEPDYMERHGDVEEMIRQMPGGILNWYPFGQGGKVLCLTVDEEKNPVAEMLQNRGIAADAVPFQKVEEDNFPETHQHIYAYIVAVGILERERQPQKALRLWRSLLTEHGTLLLAVENRFALRFFCGDRDPYTDRNFDGIENYRRVDAHDLQEQSGRDYAKAEVEEMLRQAGFMEPHAFSVMPGLEAPQLVYAEDILPNEDLANRFFPMYHHPDTVFLEEEYLYSDLAKNGMFHDMAGAYLFECTSDEAGTDICHVTLTMDRGKERDLMTVIRGNGTVEKRAIYPEGERQLQKLEAHACDLRAHGVPVVQGELCAGAYVMPLVKAKTAVTYFTELLMQSREKFITEVDRYCALIRQSSEQDDYREGDLEGEIYLKKGYMDLVPLNCFVVNDEFTFFDQEFCFEHYPLNAILLRVILVVYSRAAEMEGILPHDFFMKRYGIDRNMKQWLVYNNEFLTDLRNERPLRIYHEQHRRDYELVNTNRQRMNYSAMEYQHLFVDIFRGIQGKCVYLFGSGTFAGKFVTLYGKKLLISGILDNNQEKWGSELGDIQIMSPDVLRGMEAGSYRVIICIKKYTGVVKQLKKMDVSDYVIYDTNMEYPEPEPGRTDHCVQCVESDAQIAAQPKKYHIGYIAGVFDLFHVGHLNMFRRAKEQCDYLIVGVVTDEGVRRDKKTEPFIPFTERIEIVRSCRYVDEAVEIPLDYAGSRDAYRLYHFDVQFSGSDYVDDPNWLAEREFLRKQGSELVFFPYTESTSSTKIKAMIDHHLL